MLSIQAGGINPSSGEPGHQRPVKVRGQDGVLASDPSGTPLGTVWVWWEEPGRWTPTEGAMPVGHVRYALWGKGISEDELLTIADSLVRVER